MPNNLGITVGAGQEETKEKAETLLTIRKRCGTLIEGPDCPYRVYVDTAQTRDPYYSVPKRG